MGLSSRIRRQGEFERGNYLGVFCNLCSFTALATSPDLCFHIRNQAEVMPMAWLGLSNESTKLLPQLLQSFTTIQSFGCSDRLKTNKQTMDMVMIKRKSQRLQPKCLYNQYQWCQRHCMQG